MPIAIRCSNCSSAYNVDDRFAGKKVKCKNCGGAIAVPGGAAAVAAPMPPPDQGEVDFDALVAAAGAETSQGGYTPPPAYAPAYTPPAYATTAAVGGGGASVVGGFYVPAPIIETAPRRKSAAVGLDSTTPWMIICYIVADIIGGIVTIVATEGANVGLVVTGVICSIVLYLLILGPALLLGMFLTSRMMKFELVDSAYLKSCGVAAVPGILVVLAVMFRENQFLAGLMLVAIVPVTFYVLKYVFDLTWAEAAMGFLMCAIFYVPAQVGRYLLLTGILAGAVVGGQAMDRLTLKGDGDEARQPYTPPTVIGPGSITNNGSNTVIPPPPPITNPSTAEDQRQAKLETIRRNVENLGQRNFENVSREQLQAQLVEIKKEHAEMKATAGGLLEWRQITPMLADLERRIMALPSELPDPAVFEDPKPKVEWVAARYQLSQLDTEVSYKGFKIRPPKESVLDLRATEEDADGFTWQAKGGRWTKLSVSTVARGNDRQKRPVIATRDFGLRAAEREKLYVIDATQSGASGGGAFATGTGTGGAPTVEMGRINGIAFTRVASGPGPRAERWVKYIALDEAENRWLIVSVTAQAEDATGASLFEAAARTIRRARPGEPKADPFAPERLAALLAEDGERAAAILRTQGAAAEKALIPVLKGKDIRARRLAAEVLGEIATKASIPALTEAATSTDPEVAEAARAALRRITPDSFDAVAEALTDLKSNSWTDQKKALNALAQATPDKRKTQIAPLLENILLGDRNRMVHADAADALSVWATEKTAQNLLPILEEKYGDRERRHSVMRLLAQLKDKRAVFPIVRWIAVDERAATDALIEMGAMVETDVMLVLKDRDSDARLNAARVLQEVGTSKSLPALARAQVDRRGRTALHAAQAAREAADAIKERIKEKRAPGADKPPADKPAADKEPEDTEPEPDEGVDPGFDE